MKSFISNKNAFVKCQAPSMVIRNIKIWSVPPHDSSVSNLTSWGMTHIPGSRNHGEEVRSVNMWSIALSGNTLEPLNFYWNIHFVVIPVTFIVFINKPSSAAWESCFERPPILCSNRANWDCNKPTRFLNNGTILSHTISLRHVTWSSNHAWA